VAIVTRIYDLVMTHKLDTDDFFIHRVQQHCAERGLNFFLIEPTWVDAFYRLLEQGRISPRVLLNMHSEHHEPTDIYRLLVNLAFEKKVRIIDPPDLAQAAFDKANLHPRLAAADFRLPYTVIVPRDQIPGFRFSDAEMENLGCPFVVKPSLGYGKRGVILDALGAHDLLRSQKAWPDPAYLVQRKIVPQDLGGTPGYFRIFYVFSAIWICWWNCYTDQYRLSTVEELERYALHPLQEIACNLARLTRMNFFSTEVALADSGEFVLIDYVNDQCHMLTQSANPLMGVPDEVVAGIARRLVDGAQQLIARNG
jgi:hypothetical protein